MVATRLHALLSDLLHRAMLVCTLGGWFNGGPCGRGVVSDEARQMDVGDVGDADAGCRMLDAGRWTLVVRMEKDRWVVETGV